MTKKQGLRAALFLLVLCMALGALIRVFGLPAGGETYSTRRRFQEFYSETRNTWDCVLIGTSCIDREWVAPLAWKEYGMTAYAMNTDAQPLYLTTFLLDEIRKTQDVRLVVVDMRGIRMESLRPAEARVRRITDSTKMSANRTRMVERAIGFTKEYAARDDVRNPEKLLAQLDEPSLYFPFLKYHSRWKDKLYADDFLKSASDMKGVYDNKAAFRTEKVKPTVVVDEVAKLNEMQTGILDEIVQYGEDAGLEMLFISSPSRLGKKEQPEINAAIRYLEEKGAKVINYNTQEKYEEIGLDFSSDLYNDHHMNSRGAVKFTEYFARYLHEHYQFEDKRGREGYRDWDQAYVNYVKFYEEGWKEAEASK